MKKILILSSVALAMLATACDDDVRLADGGEGRLVLSPEIKSDVRVVSRAAADEDQLRESLILWISNNKGPVRKYVGEANVPAEEWLAAGKYLAEAWAGDSVSASFDKRWFKGSAEFEIHGGETSNVTVPCKIANVLVEVSYADDLAEILSDFTMSVGHKRGEVVFEGADTRTAYFMMPSYDKDLRWTLNATTKSGDLIQRSGTIANAKPATKYVLDVHYDASNEEIGGSYLDIVVDETEEDVYDDIVIDLPPVIQGMNFDPTQELVAKAGEVGRRSLFISASTGLKSAKISLENFSSLLGIKDVNGNDFIDFDFVNAEEAFLENVRQQGINSIYSYDAAEDVSSLKINFEEEFTSRPSDGLYAFTLEVVDAKDRLSTLAMNIRVSNDPLRIEEVNAYDVWAKNATLSATALREEYGNASFEYRKLGDATWLTADVNANGSALSAELTSLEPATTYEYRIVTDADGYVSDAKTFETEAALQLPNAGFEEWNTSAKAWLLCSDRSNIFWDSGNHGSSTMGKNITQPDTEVKHSGEKSLKMMSQFVGVGLIGKFAAGNAFVGEYLATEGTDGLLGWGRPFASRPKALKGYVKYTPAAVTHVEKGFDKKSIGDMDEAIVYIAILTDATEKATTTDKFVDGVTQKDWPVIVRTKKDSRKVFDKTNSNVIAYGEKVFTSATPGDGMIEFEIPLEYFHSEVKASNIMVTCSASRYGDYFTGGPSVMYIDDLELVY